MHIQLLIPDLLFKRPAHDKAVHPLFELELPSLTMLLDGALEAESLIDEEYNLAQNSGLDMAYPYGAAALSAEFEGLAGKTGSWLRADPVRMQVSQDAVFCLGQHNLTIDPIEAQGFIESINALLQEENLSLQLGKHPLHWYSAINEELHSVPLSRVIGKNILDYLPKERSWRKRLTEIQMLLKQHPLNLQRQKMGLPLLDSLWLWGEGRYPRLVRARKDVLYADNDFAEAVARAANLPYLALPKQLNPILEGPYQKIMLSSHQLKLALEQGNIKHWQSQVLACEQGLFLPLLLALKNKLIDSIVLDFSRGLSYTISRRELKKWWKRPVSLKERLENINI